MLTRTLLGVVLCAGLASAENLSVSGIVAFGDSLSDGGNDYIGTSGQYPAAGAYGGGEFTDGTNSLPGTAGPLGVWVDQLAPKLGVSRALPSLAGGTNFAFGGSETLTRANIAGFTVPSLNDEVNLALAATHGALPSNYLYTFWSGANDIGDNPTTPGIGTASADDIYAEILTAAAAGGKNFLWLNMPPLGETPDAKGQPGGEQIGNYDSVEFNNEFNVDVQKLQADGINVIPVDVYSLFGTILADFQSGCTVGAADPYCFANIGSPAQFQNVDPNTYLFWDADHPTTAADALIADAAYAAIQDAPEPASIALGALGLIGVSLIGRRKFFRK